MGTNYYARYNACKCCDRFDAVHIGKQSAGWTFLFRGYVNSDETPLSIKTFSDWKKFLDSENVEIYDEYNERVSKTEFLARIQSKAPDIKQDSTVDRNLRIPHHGDDYWIDESGNCFCGTWFS